MIFIVYIQLKSFILFYSIRRILKYGFLADNNTIVIMHDYNKYYSSSDPCSNDKSFHSYNDNEQIFFLQLLNTTNIFYIYFDGVLFHNYRHFPLLPQILSVFVIAYQLLYVFQVRLLQTGFFRLWYLGNLRKKVSQFFETNLNQFLIEC